MNNLKIHKIIDEVLFRKTELKLNLKVVIQLVALKSSEENGK
ncbi:hypothetical protein [Marinigracilibium pacificum]|nr:hypothetical protein [Marinigracilibium pacificum]